MAVLIYVSVASAGQGPGPRAGHTLVYDSATSRALLVDGYRSDDSNADGLLWAWDGKRWREVGSRGPGPRTMSGVALDSGRHVLVVYGGLGILSGTRYGDTWEWDGKHWAERRVRGPGPRDHHVMVYDPSRRRVVMFGGELRDGTEAWPSDTWEWDGSTWRKSEVQGPGGRVHHAMAYDAARKAVLLFGGVTQDGETHGDLWAWDGATWRLLSNDGPQARSHHALAFDEAAGTLVLYGGVSPAASGEGVETLDDTWLWDGRSWTRAVASGLGKRRMQAMTYDARSNRILLYGGSAGGARYETDLWAWDGKRWLELEP